MTEHDELPSWSADQRPRAAVAPEPRRPSRGRRALFALFGLVALAGMGVLGYMIAQSQADETTATDPGAPTAVEDDEASSLDSEATTDEGSEDALSDDDAVTAGEVSADDAALDVDAGDAETGDSADGSTATGIDDSGRTAVFRGGKLYLGGKVPSQEIADLIVQKAMSVVGPDNVVSEYEIDPSVTIDPGESTPLYVEDVVLFRFNSVDIDPPFYPLLDLGTLLLSQNPQASLTVVTRTDAVGSEAVNLDVARRRADAVIEYWISKGVNPDQLNADPRGEEGASEDDDAQMAALQRRAEFIITGLLD
ncbi:MAG: OmpA family protein [Acidimicrobiia bacterium]|nr:OmpA family protein [Acidimicrobiia bacterium]